VTAGPSSGDQTQGSLVATSTPAFGAGSRHISAGFQLGSPARGDPFDSRCVAAESSCKGRIKTEALLLGEQSRAAKGQPIRCQCLQRAAQLVAEGSVVTGAGQWTSAGTGILY
jgi:hypothetical protein